MSNRPPSSSVARFPTDDDIREQATVLIQALGTPELATQRARQSRQLDPDHASYWERVETFLEAAREYQ